MMYEWLETFFQFVELAGTLAFAASGAMIAIDRELDMFGVLFLGVTAAVGGGIVRDEAVRAQVVEGVRAFGTGELGLEWVGVRESPIRGAAGNVEYTAYWRKPCT